MDSQRINNTTREVCEPWLSMVQREVFSKKIPPRYIINVDETPFGGNVLPAFQPNVITGTDSEVLPVLPTEPRHVNVTITLAVSMDGTDYPAQIIWKGSSDPPEFAKFNPLKVKLYHNDSGYQDCETFYAYMSKDVIPPLLQMRSSCKEDSVPIIIFLDGHTSRFSSEFKAFCAHHNIIVILYPSHTSHYLQVLDQNLNATLKQFYNLYLHDLSNYKSEDPSLVPYGIPSMDHLSKEAQYRERFVWSMKRALQDTLTTKTICNAWKMAGLFNELTIQEKISSVQPSGVSTPFNEADYLLSSSPRNTQRKAPSLRKQKQRECSQKPPAKNEKPTSMPTINAISRKPQKIHARDLLKQEKTSRLQQKIKTRSGRTVLTYDWSMISSPTQELSPTSSG